MILLYFFFFFFFQAEDGIRDLIVTGVQTCALPISAARGPAPPRGARQRRVQWSRAGRRAPRTRTRARGRRRRRGGGPFPRCAGCGTSGCSWAARREDPFDLGPALRKHLDVFADLALARPPEHETAVPWGQLEGEAPVLVDACEGRVPQH